MDFALLSDVLLYFLSTSTDLSNQFFFQGCASQPLSDLVPDEAFFLGFEIAAFCFQAYFYEEIVETLSLFLCDFEEDASSVVDVGRVNEVCCESFQDSLSVRSISVT
jgi:hypothetical protein